MTKGFKVDKKFFRRWVKALESGKYAQTVHALKKVEDNGSTSYCCLGVACQLKANAANKERPWGKKGVRAFARKGDEYAGACAQGFPPSRAPLNAL